MWNVSCVGRMNEEWVNGEGRKEERKAWNEKRGGAFGEFIMENRGRRKVVCTMERYR